MSRKGKNSGKVRLAVFAAIFAILLYHAFFPADNAGSSAGSIASNSENVAASTNVAGNASANNTEEPGPLGIAANQDADRYDAVVSDAEALLEQYPDMSWSSQWEELSNLGYSDEEIAWAIGG